jgi:hypothetical protein
MLTPDIAKKMLENNPNNRSIRKSKVNTLANAIRRGEWVLTHQGIATSNDGTLIDGQHRCMAVIEADIPIPTLVTTGISDPIFHAVDNHSARGNHDYLSCVGYSSSEAKTIASIARMVHAFAETGNPTTNLLPTPKQIADTVSDAPDIAIAARFAEKTTWCRKYVSPSVTGFCYLFFTRTDKASAHMFFAQLESGVDLSYNSPVLRLREVIANVFSTTNKAMNKSYKTALIFKAFRLFQRGQTVKTLRVRVVGPAPEKDMFSLDTNRGSDEN